jgi:DNA modification methylase
MTQILRDKRATGNRSGDIVFDPFPGSGSTLSAAERADRICRGIEIDPLYIANRRWRRVTDERAVHAENGVDFDELELEKKGARHER